MTLDESLRSLSLDYLNLLINGQAFSDVTFSVEGRLVHAHRCILAARSLFFRKFFCGPDPPSGLDPAGSRINSGGSAQGSRPGVIPVNSVGYEVFLLLLQFLYSGQVSIVPQKHEPRPNCGERGCWHTHCTSAVDLALDTLAAARSFGVEQLALLTQVFAFLNSWIFSSSVLTYSNMMMMMMVVMMMMCFSSISSVSSVSHLSLITSFSLGQCDSVWGVICFVGFGNLDKQLTVLVFGMWAKFWFLLCACFFLFLLF